MTPFDSTESGFRDMPLFDAPAPPASVGQAARHHRLRTRFLRAGREAVDDRELLELLLSGCGVAPDAHALLRDGYEPYSIDVPEGWEIRLAPPLVVRANGVCLGAVLTLRYQGVEEEGIDLEAPFCRVDPDA